MPTTYPGSKDDAAAFCDPQELYACVGHELKAAKQFSADALNVFAKARKGDKHHSKFSVWFSEYDGEPKPEPAYTHPSRTRF